MAEQGKLISFGDEVPDGTVRQVYTSVQVVPDAHPQLGFRIVLPRSWSQVGSSATSPIVENQFSILAAFAPSERVGVQVLATRVPWEVNPVDWVEFQAYQTGTKILDLQSGNTEYGQTVHAAGEKADGSHVRLMATGDGPIMIVLVGFAPGNSPPDMLGTLGLAAASFQFLSHSGAKTREPLVQFTDKQNVLQLLRPQSWVAQPVETRERGKGGTDLRITSDTDTLAYMRVEWDSRVPMDDEGYDTIYEILMAEIRESGIKLEDLEELQPSDKRPEQARFVGPCSLPSGGGVVSILIQPGTTAWLALVMVCPDREVNPYAWMRGKRGFEIAAASLTEVAPRSRDV